MSDRTSASWRERADRRATRQVNHIRRSWPMRAIGIISDIGDQPQMRLLTAAIIAAGLIRRDQRLCLAGAKMLATHTLATWGKDGIKAVVDRRCK